MGEVLKRSKIIMVAIALALAFSACGKGSGTVSQSSGGLENAEETVIVTSFYPMYIFTMNIAKDIQGVSVFNMTEPETGCLHDYQLKPADMKLLEKADIFVANGVGMEGFLEKVVQQMPNLKIVEASKGMELLPGEPHEHEDNEGKYDEEKDNEHEEAVNPHVWVSISGAISEVKNIGEQLSEYDPANAEKYKANSEEYIKKLNEQKEKMHDALKNIKTKDVVTLHEAFPYFAKEFGLNIVHVIEREPGAGLGAGELRDIIEKIGKANVKVLFAEPQYPTKTAETIAMETGAKVYFLDPVVTGPEDADADDYIKAMDKNLQVLLEALN